MTEPMKDALRVIETTLRRASSEGWTQLQAKCPILHSNLGGVETTQVVDGKHRYLPVGTGIFDIQKACLFLRSQKMANGEGRIWGLTFALYPDGHYEVKYDYNKPEDYEETDDVIIGDEINRSLAGLNESERQQPAMSVEDAYHAIGRCVMLAQGDSTWTMAGVEMDYRENRQVLMRFWQEISAGRVKAPYVPEQPAMAQAADAAYVLYDHLTRGGGTAPSGLSMRLTPAGKMKREDLYPDADI